MKLRPGSFSWLAAHDLRQTWRGFDAALGGLTRAKAAMLAGAVVALHALFWWGLRRYGEVADDAALSPYIALGVLFVLPGIVAQAVTAATRALYAHGDLDLLFASPISARAVLGSKAVAIAANAIAWFAILLAPLANVNALAGHFHWLAVYPALLACGLFGTEIGVGLALALFAAVGPRRARLVSQIAATVVGASFMLGLQGYALAPARAPRWPERCNRRSTTNGLTGAAGCRCQPGRRRERPSARPVDGRRGRRLRRGDVRAGRKLCARGDYLRRGAAPVRAKAQAARVPRKPRRDNALEGAASHPARSLADIANRFAGRLYGAGQLRLWRNGGATGSPGVVFAPLIVVVGAQLAGSLAWLALSGEDAPDLLRAAPVSSGRIGGTRSRRFWPRSRSSFAGLSSRWRLCRHGAASGRGCSRSAPVCRRRCSTFGASRRRGAAGSCNGTRNRRSSG